MVDNIEASKAIFWAFEQSHSLYSCKKVDIKSPEGKILAYKLNCDNEDSNQDLCIVDDGNIVEIKLDELYAALHNPSGVESGEVKIPAGFEDVYKDATVKRFLLIPTRNLSYYANFTHDVHIIRKGKLRNLKNNIKSFIREMKTYNISEISDEKIDEWLSVHHLDINSLKNEYCEAYYHKSK